uniref:RNA polymerase II elongation factor ELL N-terminal domain-containing protein n=1 Tax=Anopheles atroparvus TaxID=41427 RepID=A0A182J830_ANOAO
MAALCAGNYGLSQQGSLNDENKELIFVKLTDSALRAIEEFQRTQLCHDLVELFRTRPDSIPLRTVLLALGTHLPKGFLNAFHPFVERNELIFSSRW